jgi:DNA-binding NarL/FixJ family response regulator
MALITASKSRILLADDHPALLAETASLLQRDHEVVGTATNGLELLDQAERLHPNVIVLDISMPVMDGFEAARRLKQSGCRSKLVFLTVSEDADFAREALALGAEAYVVKSRLASDLVGAISDALVERQFVSPTIEL